MVLPELVRQLGEFEEEKDEDEEEITHRQHLLELCMAFNEVFATVLTQAETSWSFAHDVLSALQEQLSSTTKHILAAPSSLPEQDKDFMVQQLGVLSDLALGIARRRVRSGQPAEELNAAKTWAISPFFDIMERY